jgi:hypothetical protein
LKINAATAAGAFCRLHNDKYTKIQPGENCGLRDNHIKGTSHRKEESDCLTDKSRRITFLLDLPLS